MWEELFRHPPSLERHRSAPLGEDRLKYLRQLRDGGFGPGALRRHAADLLRLVGLLDLTERRVVSVCEVQEAAREWSRPGILRFHRPASAQVRARFVANSVRWLRFQGWLEEREKPPRHPHTAEVAVFAAWARGERGYAEATVESCCEDADEFFDFLAGRNTRLGSVTIVDVDRAIAAKSARGNRSRRTIDRYAKRLRMFFRFAEDRRWCRPGIAAAIGVPRLYVNEDVPARLNREDVVRLLADHRGRPSCGQAGPRHPDAARSLRSAKRRVARVAARRHRLGAGDVARTASQAGANARLPPVAGRGPGHPSVSPGCPSQEYVARNIFTGRDTRLRRRASGPSEAKARRPEGWLLGTGSKRKGADARSASPRVGGNEAEGFRTGCHRPRAGTRCRRPAWPCRLPPSTGPPQPARRCRWACPGT